MPGAPAIVANVSATGIHCSAMKAAILHAAHELRVEASRTPEPGGDDALVRVAVAGLCGTDYSIFSGDRRVSYPRVMGHEFVGRVEAAGTRGLLALQVLAARGARVLVVSRSTRRFALAAELGAAATHAVGDGPLDEAARAFSGREGIDCVVETAGTPEAVSHALALVRPGGRVVLTGLPHEATAVPFFSVVRREVTIVGSMIYQDEFAEAMRLVAAGQVRTRPLITHRFALDEIERAFVAHREPDAIKVALVV